MTNHHKSGALASAGERQQERKGEPIIGERSVWWTVAGLLIGSAVGWFVGLSVGYGQWSIRALAPLTAGGAGVVGVISASVFGSLMALTGAILGTASESRHRASEDETHARRHATPLVHRLPLYGSVALALFMAYTLFVIASRAIGSGAPSDQSNRVTWHQKNATRAGGADDSETARYVLQMAYPATGTDNGPGSIVTVPNDWRAALAVTPLVARPTNAALIIDGDAGAAREVERLRVSSNAIAALGVDTIARGDPAAMAAAVDERRSQASGGVSPNVIVVSADADYRWALPAGAYAAREGTPILFVTKDAVPPATVATLEKRAGRARLFVLGPTEAVPQSVVDRLAQFGEVRRIEGADPFENAVRFAEFRDEAADFGWGHTARGTRRRAVTNTILVNPARWQDGVIAAHLARGGKSGPVLLTNRDRLPAIVDTHLWRQRPIFASTPAEGPFNHAWIVGSFDRISYEVQAWSDYSQEIEQYMTLSDSAVSGYEALGIGWLLLSLACAVWILFHSLTRMREVLPMMKAAWTLFALLLGPLAVWFYIASYHRREKMKHGDMVMWHRPLWLQTVSATVMMFAFDMMLMCLAVFAVAYAGFPILRFDGPFYWLGSSMFLMMVLMYVIALVVMMLVFHTPMTMHERKLTSYGKAFAAGLPLMMGTMTVESVGMMPTMWWQQMVFLPAMQMPTEDDFTMWTTLLFSAFIGFLVVLPFNYWLVRREKKMGMM